MFIIKKTKSMFNILMSITVFIFIEGTLLFLLMLYTSEFEQFFWYDSESLRFLHLVFTSPILFTIINIFNLMINKPNASIMQQVANDYPIICMVGTTATFVFAIFKLPMVMVYSGIGITIVLLLLNSVVLVHNLRTSLVRH